MNKGPKIALAAATGVALVLALALAAPSVIDWNRLKPRIAAEIERLTGRTVAIDGDIDFTVLPTPQLSARHVRVGNIRGAHAADFLRLNSLDMRMAFWPLLAGDLRVTSLRLVQPAIALEVLTDGRKSWDFGQGGFFNQISFDHFEIVDGSLFYRVAASGFSRAATDINAKLSFAGRDGPFQADGRFTVNGVELAGAFHLDRAQPGRAAALKADMRLGPSAGLVFSGARVVTGNGPFVSGKLSGKGGNIGQFLDALARLGGWPHGGAAARLTGPFTVNGAISDDSHVFDARDLVIKWPGSAGLLHLRLAKAARDRWDVSAAFSQIDLQTLTPPDPKTPPLEWRVPEGSDAKFDIGAESVLYNTAAAQKVALRGTIDNGVLTLAEARAQLPGGGRIAATGTARQEGDAPLLSGHVDLRAPNSRALLGWIGVDVGRVPRGRLGAGSVVADVALSPVKWALANLDARLDGARATGALGHDDSGPRPAWTADLAIDSLDWNAYRPAQSPPRAQAGAGPWRALNETDAAIKLRLGRFAAREWQGTGVSVDAGLANGVLTLAGFSAQELNGATVKLSGSATNFAAEPQMTLQGEITARDFAGLAALAGIALPAPGPIFGGGRLAGTLTGGRDQAAFDLSVALAGLDGRVTGQVAGGFDFTGGQIQIDATGSSYAETARRLNAMLPKPAQDGAVAVQGTLSRAGNLMDVNLAGTLADGAVTLAGKIADPGPSPVYHLWLTMAHSNGPRMVRALGWNVQPQNRDPRPFALQMALNGPAGDLALSELSAKLGDLSATGGGQIGRTGDRPRLALALAAGDLALDGWLDTPKTGLMAAQRQPGLRWSHDPFDLDWLRDCDLDLDLSASRLIVHGFDFGAPHLQMQTDHGVATLRAGSARLFGGALSATGALDGRSVPALTLALDVKDGSLDQALRALAGLSGLQGRLGLGIRLTARGASEADMVSSTQAVANILAQDGELPGIDLPRLADARPDSGQAALNLAASAFDSGRTPFDEIGGQVDISRGIATIRNVVMDVGEARGALAGRIDLPNWRMDMTAGFAPDPSLPAVELALRGPVHAPERVVRARKYAARIALDRLQDVIAIVEKK